MGWLSRLFKRRPVDVPQAKEEAKELPKVKEIPPEEPETKKEEKPKKTITLKEAKKLDGWEIYKAKNLVDEELLVEARLFTEDDPIVDLETAKSEPGTYVSICDLGASIFDKETFEDTYEKV